MQQGQPDNGRIEDNDNIDHGDDVDDDDNVDCVASSTGNMRMCGFDVDDVENLILLSPRIRSTVPHHLHSPSNNFSAFTFTSGLSRFNAGFL